MSGAEIFFGTNVVLNLQSADAAKADLAEELLSVGGIIGAQILNEFSAVASRKLRMPWPEIRDVLAQVRAVCTIEPPTEKTHERGRQITEGYGLLSMMR